MKKAFTFCIILAATAIMNLTQAQNCVSTNHPGYPSVPDTGVLLPQPLPDAYLTYLYTQVFTIGIPSTAQGYSVNWIRYNHYETYLTPANTWTVVNDLGNTTWAQWQKLTWQCVTLSGTPITAGVDSIIIYVDVNVSIIGFPYTQTNVRGFSLPITIHSVTGVDNNAGPTRLIQSHPNPFTYATQIGLSAERAENATLNVYSYMGQLVYTETLDLSSGENYFTFDGSALAAGTYIYTVVTPEKIYRDKLVKTE
jgi:hypothetical protein